VRGVNLTPRTLLATSRLELALTEKARSIISAMRAAVYSPVRYAEAMPPASRIRSIWRFCSAVSLGGRPARS